MTAAERKVRERYPDAVLMNAGGGLWRVWIKTAPGAPQLLGFGLSAECAWESATRQLQHSRAS